MIPKGVALAVKKCPECKEALNGGRIVALPESAAAHCPNENCGYAVQLFWFGRATGSLN